MRINEPIIYPTIQVVPLSEVKAELEKLYNEIAELKALFVIKRDETILSDAEAAQKIGKSESTLRRMKQDGRIKSVRTAHGLACRSCDVNEYLENH